MNVLPEPYSSAGKRKGRLQRYAVLQTLQSLNGLLVRAKASDQKIFTPSRMPLASKLSGLALVEVLSESAACQEIWVMLTCGSRNSATQ